MHGIIFYARTETRFPHHLNIKVRPLGNPLSLNKLVLTFKVGNSFLQLLFDSLNCPLHLVL